MTVLQIPASVVGLTAGPREHEIDARWLMAYAAALGEEAPEYFDTTRSGGILAHPLFPVCYEWPLALDVRDDWESRLLRTTADPSQPFHAALKTLTERDLEVAVLDRTKERRKFRRIPAEVLHQLLIDTA